MSNHSSSSVHDDYCCRRRSQPTGCEHDEHSCTARKYSGLRLFFNFGTLDCKQHVEHNSFMGCPHSPIETQVTDTNDVLVGVSASSHLHSHRVSGHLQLIGENHQNSPCKFRFVGGGARISASCRQGLAAAASIDLAPALNLTTAVVYAHTLLLALSRHRCHSIVVGSAQICKFSMDFANPQRRQPR